MDYQSALPHPLPFSRGEKGVKSLSLRERGWGEGRAASACLWQEFDIVSNFKNHACSVISVAIFFDMFIYISAYMMPGLKMPAGSNDCFSFLCSFNNPASSG
jgi:hypothetical protein